MVSGGTFELAVSGVAGTGGIVVLSGASLDCRLRRHCYLRHRARWRAPSILSAGATEIFSGGTLSGLRISSGIMVAEEHGAVISTAVLAGGTLELLSGTTRSGVTPSVSGGTLAFGASESLSGYQVSCGISPKRPAAALPRSITIVSSGGMLLVASGGEAPARPSATVVWPSCLRAAPLAASSARAVFSSSSGSDQVTSGPLLRTGAILELGSDYVASGNLTSAISGRSSRTAHKAAACSRRARS